MANFSDDENFEIDTVLGERKRKGGIEYLVQYNEAASQSEALWEPAAKVAAEGAKALKDWITKQKEKKRSSSRSRKNTSRSRSRSSSRSRKSKASPRKSQSRSRSRGSRSKKTESVKKEESEEKKEIADPVSASASSSSSEVTTKTTEEGRPNMEQKEKKALEQSAEENDRVLRSSTMERRKQLEVQRVHNEQRPVREDDSKPRSAIWKVADYAVIILFIISLFAALILFLEKFFDLEDFKKQAYPNFGVLKRRLMGAQQRLIDFIYVGADYVSDVWLYLVEQIKGTPDVETSIPKQTSAPGA